MISIDGIQINRVTSIECSGDTGYMAKIRFHCDSRIKGCTPVSELKDYSPVISEETDEDIGEAMIMLPNSVEIHFKTNAR